MTVPMTALSQRVHRGLAARADPAVKASAEKYFRGAIPFIGVKRAGVDAVLKEVLASVPAGEAGVREAFALLRAPSMEMRQIGIELLYRRRKQLDDAVVDELASYFDTHVGDWATCDGVAGRVLRALVKRPSAKKKVLAWSRARCTWRKRAAAVAFVNDARKGEGVDDLFAVCARIVTTPDRFVQLGCGWALRELSLVDRPRVVRFIEDHAAQLSREGLRYAVEKMPKAERAAVMKRHAALKER